jgi:RNA polymerase-binding transcription factor DksA
MLNTVHNGYRLTQLITHHSMGGFYQAESVSDSSKKFLLHLIDNKYFLSPSVAAQYQDWFGVLKQLRHESLLTCIDYWTASDYHGVVYEYFEGTCLQRVINDRSIVWDRDQIDNLVGDVLSTLQFVAEEGHSHLQLNPRNLVYNSTTGEIKVHSFFFNTTAWANYVSALPIELLTDEVLGVMTQDSALSEPEELELMNYMSPEQVEGLPLNSRSDIYSAGVLLFRLATQNLPYVNFQSEAEYADRLQALTVADRLAEFEGLPENLIEAIAMATAIEPAQRFISARDFEGKIRQIRNVELSEMTNRVLGQDESVSAIDERTEYSELELEDFRRLIERKLSEARKELTYLQDLITRETNASTADSEDATEREQLDQMASRQITYIDQLEKALFRIENKTYGICRITGKLIEKERLMAVPHATVSQHAKDVKASKDTIQPNDSADVVDGHTPQQEISQSSTSNSKSPLKPILWVLALIVAGYVGYRLIFPDPWSKAPIYHSMVAELALRSDTGVNSPIQQVLEFGQQVRVINIPEIYPWVRVKTFEGVEGFVYKPMLVDPFDYGILSKVFINSRMLRHIDQFYRRKSVVEYYRNSDMWNVDSTLKWKPVVFYKNGDDRYAFQKRRSDYSYFRIRIRNTYNNEEKDVIFVHRLQSTDVWEEVQRVEYNSQENYLEYYISSFLKQFNLD